jgi:hypothetical protein
VSFVSAVGSAAGSTRLACCLPLFIIFVVDKGENATVSVTSSSKHHGDVLTNRNITLFLISVRWGRRT